MLSTRLRWPHMLVIRWTCVYLVCRVVKFWDTRKLKVPVVQTPPQHKESEGVSSRKSNSNQHTLVSYLDLVYNSQLSTAIHIYDQWIHLSISNQLFCLIVGLRDLLQVSRVHGIASLSQDPTSSRLIASCTDSKYVNDHHKYILCTIGISL